MNVTLDKGTPQKIFDICPDRRAFFVQAVNSNTRNVYLGDSPDLSYDSAMVELAPGESFQAALVDFPLYALEEEGSQVIHVFELPLTGTFPKNAVKYPGI